MLATQLLQAYFVIEKLQANKNQEENRLRAKALRERHLAAQAAGTKRPASSISTSTSTSTTTASSFARSTPETSRNGTSTSTTSEATKIEPARKFRKYIEHDLSSMADTKGGFLAREDDPFNKGMRWSDLDTADGEKRPPHMSEKEWERLRLLRELRRNKSGPFEPGISALDQGANKERPQCRECNSLDVDFLWNEVFKVAVCGRCKEKMPEKYSLLTKTEVKDDYLLTDEECRDAELLPHLNKPNPHKSHWHDMMLFLRFQVEEYALGPKRWGSAEALDAEFEKRQKETKERKEKKFRKGLLDLKRKTRG
ncbi:MAG: DNA repair protein, partial [Leuconostoc sp.]|nr:DNA repair protein [Leuconostoc sp.]